MMDGGRKETRLASVWIPIVWWTPEEGRILTRREWVSFRTGLVLLWAAFEAAVVGP
jgi:hypothetical protein